MSGPECVGEGTGWGTIAGIRLRVLVLADPEHLAEAEGVVRAIGLRHEAELFRDDRLLSYFTAARAAERMKPQLLHAVGVSGAARPGMMIAAGLKVPFAVSLTSGDIEGRLRKRVLDRARGAHAVLVDEGRGADLLREAGIERDIYVLSPPGGADSDRLFLNALEVVYGRLLGANPDLIPESPEIPEEEPPREQLVQLRRAGKGPS